MFKFLSLPECVPALTEYISNEKLVLIGTVSVLMWVFVRRKWNYFKRQGVAYVQPTFRDLGTLVPSLSKPFEFDLENKKKLGPVYGEYTLFTPSLTIHDPNILREIFIKQFKNFPYRMVIFTKSNGRELNNGLDQVKGKQWKRIRSSLTSIFSSGKLRQMHGIMNDCGNQLLEVLHQKVLHEDGKLEAKEVLGRYSLSVLLSAAFDTSMCNQDGEEPDIVKHAKKLIDINFLANPLLLLILIFPRFENITSKLNMTFQNKKSLAYFSGLSKAIMKRSKENPHKESKTDIMQLMLDLQKTEKEVNEPGFEGKGLTELEIIGNAMIMVIAGYENTTQMVCYTAYNIAMYPEVQDKLVEEVDQAIDDDGNIDYTKLNEMKYLEMCFNETARLYTPVYKNVRTCAHDTEINGVQFKKGMVVGIPVFALHHDPDYWPKPFEFVPERMSDMSKIDPFMFQPFGQGPRNCIAMRFAKIEVKMAIAKIISKYRLLPQPDTPKPPLEQNVKATVQPKVPIVLKLEPRNNLKKL